MPPVTQADTAYIAKLVSFGLCLVKVCFESRTDNRLQQTDAGYY